MDSQHQNLNPSCKIYAGDYLNLSTADIFFFCWGGGGGLLKYQSGRLALQCYNN